MKVAHAVATALLLAVALQAGAETEDAVKLEQKQDDTQDVSPQAKSSEDSEEEIVPEDLETIIEQLREITALQDTIRSLLPPADPYKRDKTTKQQKIKGEDEEESPLKESLNAWRKSMIQPQLDSKIDSLIEQMSLSEEEEIEGWQEDKLDEEIPEETPQPLTPQEQEG